MLLSFCCYLPHKLFSDLAVSLHSVALPSLKESSSSSVKRSWGTCSRSSSSVPRINWTRWDGVSAQSVGKGQSYNVYHNDNSKFSWQHVLLKLPFGVFDSRPRWIFFLWHKQVQVGDMIEWMYIMSKNMNEKNQLIA